MGTGMLSSVGAVLFSLPEGGIRLDVATPPVLLGMGLGILIAAGILVAGIVAVAVFVIRAIKKNRMAKGEPSAPEPPIAP